MTLTAKLAGLYAVTTLIILASVGTYLYRALASQLAAREDHELVEKVEQFRHILLETPNYDAIIKDKHRFIDVAMGHHGLIVMLVAANGQTLMQNHDAAGALTPSHVAPIGQEPDPRSIWDWEYAPGKTARTIVAWAKLDKASEPVRVVVGRTASERTQLLADYLQDVLAAMVGASTLAALLGYLAVRRALWPLKIIAHQAHSITAQRLERRLDAHLAPPELQVLVESFNAALDRLQDSFQRLSQFSADLAHDLRTPLYNLTMQTQVALSQPRSNEEYIVMFSSSLEEYERLSRMVESMLFLARADNAQVALSIQTLDGFDELQRIADYFEGIAEDAKVSISVEGEGPLLVDPALFRRAVSNLVANAIRFTPAGNTIRLYLEQGPTLSVVGVANPGAGIEQIHLARIFDRFYRADQSRSRSGASTGLGLAIVDSIMKLHGGKVEVESVLTGMTTFRLRFPVKPSR
jgi:two-component system heavy metal sensor histidine kinase CusS